MTIADNASQNLDGHIRDMGGLTLLNSLDSSLADILQRSGNAEQKMIALTSHTTSPPPYPYRYPLPPPAVVLY